MLKHKKFQFVIEYCRDYNATTAAKACGVGEASASDQGYLMLQDPEVLQMIETRQQELAAAAKLTPEWILERWMKLAEGDPTDLAKIERVNCRHCFGYGGNYQWTEVEYRMALDKAVEDGKPAPDASGGFDFDRKAPPNLDCQECGGQGVERVYIADSDKVPGRSRGLFAGIKMTSTGPEIKLRDQDAALVSLSKYLGMAVERQEIVTTTAKSLNDFYSNIKPRTS